MNTAGADIGILEIKTSTEVYRATKLLLRWKAAQAVSSAYLQDAVEM